jgi:hypothetical protein
MQGTSGLTEELLAAQGHCSMQLASHPFHPTSVPPLWMHAADLCFETKAHLFNTMKRSLQCSWQIWLAQAVALHTRL